MQRSLHHSTQTFDELCQQSAELRPLLIRALSGYRMDLVHLLITLCGEDVLMKSYVSHHVLQCTSHDKLLLTLDGKLALGS